MSMLGPLTCSALTVIEPVFPPDELVCSLTMRLMPPRNERASEIPSAFARKATASPLNEVAFCAKLATGPKIKTATKHIVIVEFFFAFIACSPFDKSWPDPGRDWLQRRIGRADAHLGLAGNSPGGLGAVWYCVGIRERVG